ncbi:hypothetical protein NBRC116587_19570 [Pseudoteredinibacter isoporae]
MIERQYYPAPQLTDGAPALAKKDLKHTAMVVENSGRTPERDTALILLKET